MSQALLTFLIAICSLKGYGGSPVEEVACVDADTCLSLEEVKFKAQEQVKTAVYNEFDKLNGITTSANKIRQQMSQIHSQIDDTLTTQWTNTFVEGNKAFEEALKNGKGLPVFECIVDCELSARKTFPRVSDKCHQDLSAVQEAHKKSIEDVLNKTDAIRSKLTDMEKHYVSKIRAAITKIAVNWIKDQACKDIAAAGKNADKLAQELAGVESSYNKESADQFAKCNASLLEVRENATQCMKGCLQD